MPAIIGQSMTHAACWKSKVVNVIVTIQVGTSKAKKGGSFSSLNKDYIVLEFLRFLLTVNLMLLLFIS